MNKRLIVKVFIAAGTALLLTGLYLFYFKKGDRLSTALPASEPLIQIHEEIIKKYGFRTTTLSTEKLREEIVLPGRVDYNLEKMAIVGAKLTGRLSAVNVRQGEWVRQGAVLATVSSLELGRAEADYIKGLAKAQSLRPRMDRSAELYREKIISTQEFEISRMEYDTAAAELNAARIALQNIGLTRQEIDALPASGGAVRDYQLRSPINGIVTERTAVIGQSITPADNLFVIADLSKLWILLDVYEKDIHLIRNGARVTIISASGESLQARVAHTGAVIHPEKKTATVRVEVINPGQKLRVGQTVSAKVDGLFSERENVFSLPSEAVHSIEGKRIVMIEKSRGVYEARQVETGAVIEDKTIVISGVKPDDNVVTTGSFIIKSEYLKLR